MTVSTPRDGRELSPDLTMEDQLPPTVKAVADSYIEIAKTIAVVVSHLP
jgi:hypothetical protein